MSRNTIETIRETLVADGGGEPESLKTLFSVLYDEMRSMAGRALQKEQADEVLQTTAVVHEAYVRLAGADKLSVQDRTHFRALASRAIRRVLVDHARRRTAEKRGGRPLRETFDEQLGHGVIGMPQNDLLDLVALNEALEELFVLHPRQARIVELRFFSGLLEREVAEVLDVSRRTVQGDWWMAKAWLHARLFPDAESDV